MKNLSLLVVLFPLFLFSGVNLKNGNYFISYTDIVTTSKGKTLEMTRTYNSKSTSQGWFGYGWGSPFETRLEASLDGTVYIYENGTGGKSRFVGKKELSKSDVSKLSKKIIESFKKKTKLTKSSEAELVKKLSKDSSLRHKMAKELGLKAKFQPNRLLTSFNYGYQKLAVVPKGYKRSFESGFVQFFDKDGDLIASIEKNGYKLRFKRNKSTKKVEKIYDNSGNQFSLTWNSDGFITSIAAKGASKAEFKYNGKDLISSKDINNNRYSYGYDSYHNLVSIKDMKIKDSKRSTLKIAYEPKTFFTKSVTKRNGDVNSYKYGTLDKGSLHYWTEVTKKGLSGSDYTNKYEYEHKLRADGSQWLYRTKFITGADKKGSKLVGGVLRETFNNECCELPVKIIQGSKVSEFKYDNGRMISKKSNDGSFSKLEYDKKTKRVSKITNNSGSINYVYNAKGELSKANDSKGNTVALIYGLKGKISKMVSQKKGAKKQIISFAYNSQGKPVVIGMDGVGKINVQYDSFGQVKNVDSKGGRGIASQVTGAFQNLLSIVKPAGVNLNL